MTLSYVFGVCTREGDSLFDRAFPAVESYAPEAPSVHGGISGILSLSSTVSSIADSTAGMIDIFGWLSALVVSEWPVVRHLLGVIGPGAAARAMAARRKVELRRKHWTLEEFAMSTLFGLVTASS